MQKKTPRFLVYIVAPCGKKTRGTTFSKQSSAEKRMLKLSYLLSVRCAVVLYNVTKRRMQRVQSGVCTKSCLLSIPYARVSYAK